MYISCIQSVNVFLIEFPLTKAFTRAIYVHYNNINNPSFKAIFTIA